MGINIIVTIILVKMVVTIVVVGLLSATMQGVFTIGISPAFKLNWIVLS